MGYLLPLPATFGPKSTRQVCFLDLYYLEDVSRHWTGLSSTVSILDPRSYDADMLAFNRYNVCHVPHVSLLC